MGYHAVRDFVRERDNHQCQICDKKRKKGERNFDVHHMNEQEGKGFVFQEDHKPDELVTLCRKCHANLPHIRERMSVGRIKANQKI